MNGSSVVLCAGVFITYATISPYIAILIRSFGFSQTVTGLLLGAAEISAIAAPFFFGAWADKRSDYKTTLLSVLLLSLGSAAAIFWIKNPLVCALFIPLASAGYRSTIPLSDAVITVNIGRTGNYGKIRAVGSIAFVVIMLALQLTPFYRPVNAVNIAFWNLITAALLLGVVLCLPVPFLRPSRKPDPVKPVHAATGKSRSIWTPVFIAGVAIIFLNRLAFSPLQSYLSLYAVEYLQWDAVGLLYAVSATSETPLIFLSNKLINRFGALKLIAVTTAAVAVRLLCIALFPFKIMLITTQLLHSLTFGVFHPAAVAFIATNVPPEKRAVGMTVYMSLGTGFPTFIGNVAGGAIIEHFGYRTLFGSFIFFALLALSLYFVCEKKRK
ncbi:MAG: MFS transporter [Spirochaetaceae bacterium]|jgi:PPP family 3-phenylpropionic acid transporter|nr:MFS transporter [Spirochaetaceae bacterium]